MIRCGLQCWKAQKFESHLMPSHYGAQYEEHNLPNLSWAPGIRYCLPIFKWHLCSLFLTLAGPSVASSCQDLHRVWKQPSSLYLNLWTCHLFCTKNCLCNNRPIISLQLHYLRSLTMGFLCIQLNMNATVSTGSQEHWNFCKMRIVTTYIIVLSGLWDATRFWGRNFCGKELFWF